MKPDCTPASRRGRAAARIEAGCTRRVDAPLRDRREVRECDRMTRAPSRRPAREVAGADHRTASSKTSGLSVAACQLARDEPLAEAERVERGAVHRRHAAQRVGVLHAAGPRARCDSRISLPSSSARSSAADSAWPAGRALPCTRASNATVGPMIASSVIASGGVQRAPERERVVQRERGDGGVRLRAVDERDPSFGPSTTGASPARRASPVADPTASRGAARRRRSARAARWASGGEVAARADRWPCSGIVGAPAFSIAASRSAISGASRSAPSRARSRAGASCAAPRARASPGRRRRRGSARGSHCSSAGARAGSRRRRAAEGPRHRRTRPRAGGREALDDARVASMRARASRRGQRGCDDCDGRAGRRPPACAVEERGVVMRGKCHRPARARQPLPRERQCRRG